MKWLRRKIPRYSVNERHIRHQKKFWYLIPAVVLVIGFSVVGYKILSPAEASVSNTASKLQFDSSVSESEKASIADAINSQQLDFSGAPKVSITTGFDNGSSALTHNGYVPVTNVNSPRQFITNAELAVGDVYFHEEIPSVERSGIASLLGIEMSGIKTVSSTDDIDASAIVIIPIDLLSLEVKLLKLDDSYYLDSLDNGAIYRIAEISGEGSGGLQSLKLNPLPTKDSLLKINQTGVTALTRLMMKMLNQVGDPTYFSQYIGDYLADADITHVSNESSFKDGCTYSNTVLCSDPRFIETLKASGVDIVELTGNHNNDVGSQYNTESINLYKNLGWNTFGGGLNTTEASISHIIDSKDSKVAFLGYNYADSPNGGAIAKATTAGANSFDFEKIKQDIIDAKEQSEFVIVDIQYWECYAYPDGYIEFPECDLPIGVQKSVFRQVADLGADMVVGTQAHQPQTFEIYNGVPIYYGLGNLYFDQTQWPGTERGIILSHYYTDGTLLQTKLTPTIYDNAYQTRIATDEEAAYLLQRLSTAQQQL